MEVSAFERIQDGLYEELSTQGFGEPVPLEEEDGSRGVMFATDEVAYGLNYNAVKKQFELRSCVLKTDGTPSEWRSLATWLYDYQTGERSDVESILNDFLDVVRGPKRVALVKERRHKGKDDDRVVDSLFFFNRLINIFPELKDELNNEKIVYGQVRAVTFTKTKVLPRVEELFTKYPDSEPAKRFCSLLDDMYKNGDLSLQGIITHSIMNSLPDDLFNTIRDGLGDELQKALKFSRRLKGKKIKPEKRKKQKKVEARLES